MQSASRRDLLATFLGLPALLAGGCGKRAPALPPGRIVGVDEAAGHRLRDGPRPTVADNQWKKTGVVIVGAGVAGLAAAWRLRRAGFNNFVVLELEKQPGGTARSESTGVVPHPWGAHYLPAPAKDNRALVTLLNEMGLVESEDADGEPLFAEEALVRDPHERLYYRGEWHDGLYLHAGASVEDLAQLARFQTEIDRWTTWRDAKGRKAFAVPMARGSDDPVVTALDRQTMAEWLDANRFTSTRLRWLVDYSCRDDYGLTMEDTSAWAGLFYFAARRRGPGVETPPYLTWPEGNGRLIAHLARSLHGDGKPRLHTGLAAADLVPGKSGVDVVALGQGPERVVGFRTEQVIFAGPQFLAPYLVQPWREERPGHIAAFDYGAWMVANLHLRNRPREDGLPLAWDNVAYESPSLGYVVATHQRGLDHGPTIFTYYYPLCDRVGRDARGRLQSLNREEWAEVILSDLDRVHDDLRGLVERLDVMRWGHAMIRPRPGFVWGKERRAAAAPYRGIHFAHSDLSGLALFEEAFYQGLRAAEEVLGARGVANPSML